MVAVKPDFSGLRFFGRRVVSFFFFYRDVLESVYWLAIANFQIFRNFAASC